MSDRMLSQAEIADVCREYPFYAPHVEQIVVPGMTTEKLRVLLDLLVPVTESDFNEALAFMLDVYGCRTAEQWARLVLSAMTDEQEAQS